jgi:hypothetical protein
MRRLKVWGLMVVSQVSCMLFGMSSFDTTTAALYFGGLALVADWLCESGGLK